jgi:hypothetical protein
MSVKKNNMALQLKGPEKLPADVIKDIVNRRGETRAIVRMAQKHGISTQRVNRIWEEYYGGRLLSDYKTGLKKALPKSGEEVTLADKRVRVVVVGDKKLIADEPTTRAQVIKKTPVQVQRKEFDIDNIQDVDDNTAEIVAGEISQGNDNAGLIGAMYQLIESNKNLSESTRTNLEAARDYYEKTKNKYRKLKKIKAPAKYKNDSYSSFDDDSTTDAATDDETPAYDGYDSTKIGPRHERDGTERREHFAIPEDDSEDTGELFDEESQRPAEFYSNRQVGIRDTYGHHQGQRVISKTSNDRHKSRAQPVYKLCSESAEPKQSPRQTNNSGPHRNGAEISTPQSNTLARGFQQNSSFYSSQFGDRPGTSSQSHQQSVQRPPGNGCSLVRPI